MKPDERQLWRVLNASAITYLNLEVLFDRAPQQLGLVALDGVPLNEDGTAGGFCRLADPPGVPPGARVEFIVKGRPPVCTGLLVTRTVDTGPGGENDPNRALATITASADARSRARRSTPRPKPLPPPSVPWLGNVTPVRTRKLYFSEKPLDPNDPNSATTFYITVDGQTPEAVRSEFGHPEHHREAGNGGRLDHREPLDRAARLPHSSAAFHAARLSRADR